MKTKGILLACCIALIILIGATEPPQTISALVTIYHTRHTNEFASPIGQGMQKTMTITTMEQHWICYTNAGKVYNLTNAEFVSETQKKFNRSEQWIEVPLSTPAPAAPPLPVPPR